MNELLAFYCSENLGCICEKCLYHWSGRCPYGNCYDDLRAKENPYDKAHPEESPRTYWSKWKKDQAYWCRGGMFYQSHECDKFVEYDKSKHIVKECLEAIVDVYQDGYIGCSLVELIGCEECMKRFNEKINEEEVKVSNMMQNIEITKLHPHYDNPRKDLGDLTELAESIKSKGILQNLTVVPWFSTFTGVGADDPKKQEEMGYIVVIGHRRFAAAKLAGLTEVPCVISNMPYREQIATMLLENMQRSDLTVYEQAQGIQMMINLGDTVNDISQRTGFSETTVRRRVKLLDLDQDKFKNSMARGATLMDFAELEKIEDMDLRNKVLEQIGTSNFKYELQRAIDKEKNDKEMALLLEHLNFFATQVKDSSGNLSYVSSIYGRDYKNFKKPDDAGTAKYYYTLSNYGYVTLYGEPVLAKEDTTAKERQEKENAKRKAFEEITKRAYQLRHDFIHEFSNAAAKKNIETIIQYSVKTILDDCSNLDFEEYTEFLNIKVSENDDEWSFDSIADHVKAQPERHLLVATYLALDSEREHYYNWNGQHYDNENLNTVYDFIMKLGYEMSDEERSLRDGTHGLFAEVPTIE